MKNIPTFTEYIGTVPQLEDITELDKYLTRKEKEYCKLYYPPKEEMEWLYKRMKQVNVKEVDQKYSDRLDKRQDHLYDDALIAISILLAEGKLKARNLRRKILDFGCGSGGSSIFLNAQSDDVTAIDLDEQRLKKLIGTGLFKGKVIVGDGLKYMRDGQKSNYDLITAFYFGEPNANEDYIRHFHETSKWAIRPGGNIIMTSDFLTIDKAREIFNVPQRRYKFEVLCYRAPL
jgi:predicted TPR repeat methyltransferase